MKKFLTIFSFCVSFGSLFGMMAQNTELAQSPAVLTFTSEGCQFAKGIGLNVKQDINECTGVVRFDFYRLAGGGSIRLDDDLVVIISSSSLLAWRPAPDNAIQDTPAQKSALVRYWVFMLLALSSIVASFKLISDKGKRPVGNNAAP